MTGEKKNKRMLPPLLGFGLFAAAPFLLFNPEYAVVDILPDCIGYALILVSLRYLRDAGEGIHEAYGAFLRAAAVSAVKLLSVFLIFSGLFDQINQAASMLLFAFVFNFLELLFLIPAWKKLFSGLAYLSSDPATDRACRRASVSTRVFIVIKALCAFLPETSVLSSHDENAVFNWYEFIGMFRAVSIAVCLVAGVVWLITFSVRLSVIRRDSGLFERARAEYESAILDRPSVGVRRSIRAVVAGVCVFLLLSADVYLDSVNVLPDFLAGIAAIVLFIMMKRFSGKWKAGVAASAVYTCISAVSWIAANRFHDSFADSAVERSPEAWEAFWRFYPLKIAESAVWAAICAFIVLILVQIVRDHCGYVPASADPKYVENRIAAIRSSLYKKLNLLFVFCMLSAAASAAYDRLITLTYYLEAAPGSDGFSRFVAGLKSALCGGWWAVCLVLIAAAFVSAVSAGFAVISEADSKYMLD